MLTEQIVYTLQLVKLVIPTSLLFLLIFQNKILLF